MVVMFGDAFVVAEALTVFRVIQTNYLTKKSPKMAIEKRQPIDKQTISVLCCTQSRGRTGTGVTPLVFETNASTDSAIWASKRVQR